MSKLHNAWRMTKVIFWTSVVGFTLGHLEATYVTGKQLKHIMTLVRSGACGQNDLDNKLFWYDCKDSIFAEVLNPARTREQRDGIAELIQANDSTVKPKGKKSK